MRRLPVYFLIDTSASIDAEDVRQILNQFLIGMHQDPYLLEEVYLSFITFSGTAKIVLPLMENVAVDAIPQFEMTKETECSLSNVLCLLMDDIDKNVVKPTVTTKGDWRPIIFLLTNGAFTDNPTSVIARWNLKYKRTHLITIPIDDIVDAQLVEEISDAVVPCKNISEKSSKIIEWISRYPMEAPICSSEQEAKTNFNKELNDFLNYLKLS